VLKILCNLKHLDIFKVSYFKSNKIKNKKELLVNLWAAAGMVIKDKMCLSMSVSPYHKLSF
jgi:hypothetical protein